MKVYAVTRGEYSDSSYCVMGLFSSREKAEEAVRKSMELTYEWDRYNETIGEYELDEMTRREVGPSWKSHIEVASGKVSARYVGQGGLGFRHPERCEIDANDHEIVVVSPISLEHASKVAVEERQKRLRESGPH